jgi:hypothetical protein
VTASGFEPGEAIELWLHSAPVRLLTAAADADGDFSATVTIPATTTPGPHSLEVRGAESGSVFIDLTVLAALAATGLAPVNAIALAAALLLAGALAAVGARLLGVRRGLGTARPSAG